MASADPISPVGVSRPELTISPAAINNQPVELDSTPRSTRDTRRGSRAAVLEDMSPQEREKREQLIIQRQSNPAVMVDIPQTPGADELEKSGATTDERSDGKGEGS
ncbi:hypothetical protein Tdes44962_MAKER03632 [Teratosphaeria destructans]|uniref:Uncharacterized protein n=1 Tax=Teratosphaeria destructans TaxID=418781 RepID=A0A9W7SPI3_9PEZI|nr:hypothetical protein Tdes44962_MAKER03632 [Teratosphaeria destructans]